MRGRLNRDTLIKRLKVAASTALERAEMYVNEAAGLKQALKALEAISPRASADAARALPRPKRGGRPEHKPLRKFRAHIKRVCSIPEKYRLPSCKVNYKAKRKDSKYCSKKCRDLSQRLRTKYGLDLPGRPYMRKPRTASNAGNEKRGVTLMAGDPLTAGH